MNLQITNIRIEEKHAARIKYNHEEIKARLTNALESYGNTVVTEETVKDAKKACADLNKLAKSLDTFRKDTKKELTGSIKTFEDNVKELHSDVKEAREKINSQVEFFIEEERKEKLIKVELAILQTKEEINLKDKYFTQVELKDTYLNSSMSINKVKADLVTQFNTLKMMQDMEQMKIDTIVSILGVHNEKLRFKFDFEYFERYINDETSVADLNTLVMKKVNARLEEEQAELLRIEEEKKQAVLDAEKRVKDEADEKAAADKLKADKEKKAEIEAIELKARIEQQQRDTEAKIKLEAEQERNAKVLETIQENIVVPVEPERKEPTKDVTNTLHTTVSKMNALKEFMELHNIEYTRG